MMFYHVVYSQDVPTQADNNRITTVFSGADDTHMIITGCSSGSIRIYDTRINNNQWYYQSCVLFDLTSSRICVFIYF